MAKSIDHLHVHTGNADIHITDHCQIALIQLVGQPLVLVAASSDGGQDPCKHFMPPLVDAGLCLVGIPDLWQGHILDVDVVHRRIELAATWRAADLNLDVMGCAIDTVHRQLFGDVGVGQQVHYEGVASVDPVGPVALGIDAQAAKAPIDSASPETALASIVIAGV